MDGIIEDYTKSQIYVANKKRDDDEIDSLVARLNNGEEMDPVLIRDIGENKLIVYQGGNVAIAHYKSKKPLKYVLKKPDENVNNSYKAIIDFPKAFRSITNSTIEEAWINITEY